MQNKRTNKKRVPQERGIIKNHIYNNLKDYIIITMVFLCGVILGVLFINNTNENKAIEINDYIQNFLNKTKDNASIDYIKLLFDSIKQNLSLAILLWFAGLTVVRYNSCLWYNCL